MEQPVRHAGRYFVELEGQQAMSFDIYVGDEDDHGENYTSNMGAFFAWALDGTEVAEPLNRCDSRDAIFGERPRDGLVALNGLTAKEVAERVYQALSRIVDHRDETLSERFNAPNGWGSVHTATRFLLRIHRACTRANPDDIVRVTL
jgi:hypothetical protein